MNVHSHGATMSLASSQASRRAPDADRRERIIEAAERAFVRHGFHAATMQHVAEEAGMSPGNLYRYFPSKEAIVEGLCEADKALRAESFAAFADFLARNGDLTEATRLGMREHVLSKPPEKARMIVEIWAEAGRNPRVAEITQALDADVVDGIERLIDVAKAAGAASPGLNSRFAARFFITLIAGFFKRIAVEPSFNPDAETEMAVGVLKALFDGALAPVPAPAEESKRCAGR
jgi:TetR/AcrR family transcriptional regulator, repressor for uid operon